MLREISALPEWRMLKEASLAKDARGDLTHVYCSPKGRNTKPSLETLGFSSFSSIFSLFWSFMESSQSWVCGPISKIHNIGAGWNIVIDFWYENASYTYFFFFYILFTWNRNTHSETRLGQGWVAGEKAIFYLPVYYPQWLHWQEMGQTLPYVWHKPKCLGHPSLISQAC